MSQRANLIKCAGLITHGSELSVQEGSLKQATNVNIDEDGVITSRRGLSDYGNPTDDITEKRVKQLIEYKERLFRHFEDKIQFEDNTGIFQDIEGTYTEVRSGYRIKWKETKSNLYFTTEEGIKRISVKNNSELTSTGSVKIEQAGVPKAAYLEGDFEEKIGGFLPAQSKVSYRFIFGRKDANGNLLLGSQSARHIVTNLNDRVLEYETASITIAQSADPANRYIINDSDYIVVPSVNTKTTFYFKRSTGLSVPKPQKADTIGSSFVQVDISNIFNPNIVNNVFNTDTDYVIGDKVAYDDSANIVNYVCIADTTPGSPELPTDVLFWQEIPYDIAEDIVYNTAVAGVLANELASSLSTYDVTLTASTIVLTSEEEGNIDDISVDMVDSGNSGESPLTSTNISGSVVEGAEGNVRLSLVIPPTITDDYFVQLYRTSFLTKPEGLELSDIDPGDENNLVYEAGITANDILAGEIQVYDDRPESFRNSGASLYTNEITGEGVLQANDPPPIALDIELFRSSMFYANTKSSHKTEISLISVNDFETFKTRMIIGNSSKTRYYTFSDSEGTNEYGGDILLSDSTSISLSLDETARSIVKIINKDVDSLVNAFYLSGARDLPGNILFEARDLTDDPFFISIESGYDTFQIGNSYVEEDNVTYEGVDYKCIADVSGELPTNTLFWEVFNIEKEVSPDLAVSKVMSRLLGTGSATKVTVDDHGFSESDTIRVNYTAENNPKSYLEGESYNIGDKVSYGSHCYESLQNNNISIPPETPFSNTDWNYLYPSSFSGNYVISNVTTNDFTIEYPLALSIDSGINGSIFSIENTSVSDPVLESDNLEVANRLYYSKVSEPEAVPAINFIDVGAKDEEISRIISLRDNLFVLKQDGIYIVSGTSAPNFSVRLLDNTRILAPDSAVVLNNQIFCLTEQGVTVITDSGAGVISRGIENLIDPISNASYDYRPNTFGIAYENDRSYLLFAPSDDGDSSATQAYRYNIFERTWSRWEYSATCGHVMERDNKLYVGNGDRNYVSQERKNFDRTDNCDREFDVFISSRGVEGLEIELSSTEDVAINDVLVQTQEVSANFINRRILAKMDKLDTGTELTGFIANGNSNNIIATTPYPHLLQDLSTWSFKITYTNDQNQEMIEIQEHIVTKLSEFQFSINYDNSDNSLLNIDVRDFYSRTFFIETGEDITVNVNALNNYLFIRDPVQYQGLSYVSGISDKSINLNNILESVNTLVDELNAFGTITSLKDYKKPEAVTFEAYITSIDYRINLVTVHTERPFLQQDITVFKSIKKVTEWNPQHFGDPSALKQVSAVTILFDQNNFSIARAKFSSDLSQSLSETPINGKGIAYFGDMTWDNPNSYWGGQGNDVPYRTIVPREKQKCRYLSITFEHNNAREEFRILGITGVVRPISSRGYK